MRSLLGTQWSSGPPSPTILAWEELIATQVPKMAAYIRSVEKTYIAWCGLAGTYCLVVAGIIDGLPWGPDDTNRPLWARSWLQFGTPVDTPQLGDVLVFDFGGGDSHVTLCSGPGDDSHYECLGGNQSHTVKESLYAKSQCIGIRRPPAASADTQPEIKLGASGAAVIKLQTLLGIAQTGIFDTATDAAVRAFQSEHGLDVDGEVGYPQTWPALLGGKSAAPQPAGVLTSRGSWFSQFDGKYHWHDGEDEPSSAALTGCPDDAQGVAMPSRALLGSWWNVKAPNGVVSLEQVTDLGPAARTDRTIDISAAAAERFGYSPQNFPTDSIFTFWPADVPPEVAGLSKVQQAIRYRDLRSSVVVKKKEPVMSDTQDQPALPPAQSPSPASGGANQIIGMLFNFIQMARGPEAQQVISVALDVHNRLHPDSKVEMPAASSQPAPAQPAPAPAAPAASGVGVNRLSVHLSAVAAAIGALLQGTGKIPMPSLPGPDGVSSLLGNLTTIVPYVSMALGMLGTWGKVGGAALTVITGIADAARKMQPPQAPKP